MTSHQQHEKYQRLVEVAKAIEPVTTAVAHNRSRRARSRGRPLSTHQ